MSMSSAGRAASSSGCVGRPRALEIGLSGFAVQIRPSSLTGSYAMATAEHREPYESRGSRTVLGAPGGESPPGDSTNWEEQARLRHVRFCLNCRRAERPARPPPIFGGLRTERIVRLRRTALSRSIIFQRATI